MNEQKLEERVAALEKQLAHLRANLANGAPIKPWDLVEGVFPDDEMMHRITNAALTYRERERAKIRQRGPKAKAKSKK